MSVAEFRLWWAFDTHYEPFGRGWEKVWRIVSALVGRKSDGSAVTMEDCTPYIAPPMSQEQLAARVRAMQQGG